MPLEIVTVPCLDDNYAYLLKSAETVALIDAPEAKPILAELNKRGWSLDQILLTHHHYDHIDGVEELVAKTGAIVVGAKADAHRLPPLDVQLSDGDTYTVGAETCRVIDVSGHTIGHIAFIFDEALSAFSADSLMTWGCGRLFEGSPDTQWQTMQKFLPLPDDMLLYSGHEYTLSNAKFALSVDPDNPDVISRAELVEMMRAQDKFTVPSSMRIERATNPFLRAGIPAFKETVGMVNEEDSAVFAYIRGLKDRF